MVVVESDTGIDLVDSQEEVEGVRVFSEWHGGIFQLIVCSENSGKRKWNLYGKCIFVLLSLSLPLPLTCVCLWLRRCWWWWWPNDLQGVQMRNYWIDRQWLMTRCKSGQTNWTQRQTNYCPSIWFLMWVGRSSRGNSSDGQRDMKGLVLVFTAENVLEWPIFTFRGSSREVIKLISEANETKEFVW